MATHSNILAWRIPWTEEPGEQQVQGSQRVRHDLATKQQQHICIYMYINIYMHTYICIHQVTNPLGYKVIIRQLVKCFLNPIDTLTHAPSSTVVSYKIQNPIPVVAFET